MTKPRSTALEVVVLDDEENMGKVLGKLLTMEGFKVTTFSDPREALSHVRKEKVAVLVSDLRMPGMTGEEVLESLRTDKISTEVVLMTAYGTVESAMRCVHAGAFDYITKPFDTDRLLSIVGNAADKWRLDHGEARAASKSEGAGGALLGDSSSMENIRQLIARIAPSASAVLIHGESGTGKELAARALHHQSPRSGKKFQAINCASIPEHLMESELFGHEKGAFTGAVDARLGVFEAAQGGTLFLDEIGELPLGLQAKLLRVLQEREITRVGSVESIPVDVRIIAATNRRLEDLVKEGTFREDLFYRLNVLVVKMPALRKRPEDITSLSVAFVKEFAGREGKTVNEIEPALMDYMMAQKWPGNVRELRNFVERLVVLTDEPILSMELFESVMVLDSRVTQGMVDMDWSEAMRSSPTTPEEVRDFRAARNEFEARYLRDVLRACRGNVSEAAKRAGMSRRNFYEKVEKLGIDLTEIKEDTGR
ncbi:MAG: sigma-54-dependent Fis family transcriptional regulator [Candidatus Sumerlaeia bacterium]|nr:sigma-54-dependent Fis family transcriptional regulator [Candidatus Sumerlaeia bacterium]